MSHFVNGGETQANEILNDEHISHHHHNFHSHGHLNLHPAAVIDHIKTKVKRKRSNTKDLSNSISQNNTDITTNNNHQQYTKSVIQERTKTDPKASKPKHNLSSPSLAATSDHCSDAISDKSQEENNSRF